MEQENEQRRRLEAASRQAALNQQLAQQQKQQQEQQQVARNNKINVRKQQVRSPSLSGSANFLSSGFYSICYMTI